MTTCGTEILLVAYERAFVSLTYLKRLDSSQIAVNRFCRSEHLDPRFQPVEGQARFADGGRENAVRVGADGTIEFDDAEAVAFDPHDLPGKIHALNHHRVPSRRDINIRWAVAEPGSRRAILPCVNRRGKRQALRRHDGAGAIGIVGDEAVDAPIDEPGHVLRRVDGPRDDGEPELLRPAEALLGQVAEGGRPDLAAGALDEGGHGPAELVDVEPGGPGGGAVDALLHGVEMALARQARADELGRDGFERLEGAPVERLHDDAALHPGRAHRLGDGLGEGLGIRRVMAPGGELSLDVEADVVSAGAVNE